MKSICIVTRNLQSGGAERVIAQLLNYFVSVDIQCSLVLLYKGEIFYNIDPRVSIEQIEIDRKNVLSDKYQRYHLFRNYVLKTKPDVILSLPEEIGIYAIAANLGTHIPIVVSERNNPWVMPNKKITRMLRKALYPLADGFVFQSRQAMSFFNKKIQKKGIVLKNPLELERIPDKFEGERKKTIVSVGRLERQKNYFLLIDAFAIVHQKHPDYSLIVYGEGTLHQKLEVYASEKLAEGSWAFPGRDEHVLEKIRDSACFVLSSDYEGVPNALLESLAMGLPSISTDCEPGGARELIEDGVNGYIVPINQAEVMAEKICYILDHPDKADELSENALEIKKQFDIQTVGKMWLDYLMTISDKRGE